MVYLIPFLLVNIYMMVAETYLFYYLIINMWEGVCWEGTHMYFINSLVVLAFVFKTGIVTTFLATLLACCLPCVCLAIFGAA